MTPRGPAGTIEKNQHWTWPLKGLILWKITHRDRERHRLPALNDRLAVFKDEPTSLIEIRRLSSLKDRERY
jgi:hypothetical protein